VLMRNVLGMGLRSSAYSSGPLLVSVIIVLVSHTVYCILDPTESLLSKLFQICPRSHRIDLGCVEATPHDDPRRCHSGRGGHEWHRT
jgi:hypothetical protein